MSRNLPPLRAILNQIVLILGVCLSASVPGANAQVYEKVFSFTDARAEALANVTNSGATPYAGLVQGLDGNFYGTTSGEVTGGLGTVFKMTPGGTLTTLVEFSGNTGNYKGAAPRADLVQASGNFYGTTSAGGVNGLGTVFKMTPSGFLTTLVEFTGNGANNKGSTPYAGLVQGSDGNFYGTTSGGAQTAWARSSR